MKSATYGSASFLGIQATDVQSVLEILHSKGLNLNDLETKLADYTGWDKEYWQQYRQYLVTGDLDGLQDRLRKDGFDPDSDENYPNVISLSEQLEEDEGLWELIDSYRLFLTLNECNPH